MEIEFRIHIHGDVRRLGQQRAQLRRHRSIFLEPRVSPRAIAGSFHLTPGNAYDEADNGNRSKIHWDLVQIQRPEYGGGTIAFDGVPIRVDGRFVPPELQMLDPE